MDKDKAVALVLLYADGGRCGNRACRSRVFDSRVNEIRLVGLAPLILQNSSSRLPRTLADRTREGVRLKTGSIRGTKGRLRPETFSN
jgi:hypothetical protein